MICKPRDGKRRSFNGVEFDVLATTEASMVTKMRYRAGNEVPFHSHPNVQSGYVLSGRYRLRTRDHADLLEPGDSYSIPADLEHSVEVLEPGEVIDIFVPPRHDYL